MMFRIPAAVTLSLLVLASNTFAQGQHRLVWQNSESAIQSFKNTSQCTERAWPGFSWKGYSFLSVNNNKSSQVAYDVDAKQTYRIALSELGNSAGAMQSFSFFSANGKKWISVNESYTQKELGEQSLFGFGAHESFHHIAQKNWNFRSGSRGTLFPVKWEPRYFRAKMYSNLRQAFLNPQNQNTYLGKAAFWFDRWKNEFPEEVDRVTDGYEGTAQFAETLLVGLAVKGCEVSDENLQAYVREKVATYEHFSDRLLLGGHASADSEGYQMGAVAALILKWQKPLANWEARIAATAETPVEILLKDIPRVQDDLVINEIQSFGYIALKQGMAAASLLKDTVQTLKEDHTIVSIPRDYKSGSTAYRGFFTDRNTQMDFSIFADEYLFKGPAGAINTQYLAVGILNMLSPCQQGGWFFAVKTSEITWNGAAAKIQNPKLSGEVSAKVMATDSGQKFLCVGE